MPRKITPPPLKRRLNRTKSNATAKAKAAMLPSQSNQYRPFLVRSTNLALLMVAMTAVMVLFNITTGGSVLGAEASLTPETLLVDTNDQRVKNDLPALVASDKLDRAAEMKAHDMFAKNYWAHDSPDGTTPWQWFGVVGYSYSYAGENLAKNFTSSEAVLTAWMNSPKHRDNILASHYTEAGFAIVNGVLDGKSTTLVVAMYGTPGQAMAVAGAIDSPPVREISLATRTKMALVSMTPMASLMAFIMLLAMNISLIAHIYRRKLPKDYKETWHKENHGMIKTSSLALLLIVLISMYGGGTI